MAMHGHWWEALGVFVGVAVMVILISNLWVATQVRGVVGSHNTDLTTIKNQTADKTKLDNYITSLVAYGDAADAELRNLGNYVIQSATTSCTNSAAAAVASGVKPVPCPVLPMFPPLPPLPKMPK